MAPEISKNEIWFSGEDDLPTLSTGEAMISAVPYMLVSLLFARYRRELYGIFPRLLQRKQSVAAGAFMASVLGNQSASKLQESGLSRLRGTPLNTVTLQVLSEEEMTTDDQREALYACSSPCEPGSIDFFITHSWSDDPQLKYKALQRVGDQFREQHGGREPVVWFDKLCIDQTRIEDDIRCLPVFLMSCQKLLVLCGDSYFTRLWCLLELYVFFTMIKDATNQIEFVVLDATAEYLVQFDVANANCYLAEDKTRLTEIINSQGKGRYAWLTIYCTLR